MDNRQQRSDSTSSSASGASGQRRKSSLFSSLEQQKRTQDPLQIARRQSMHDHKPAPGMFGRWWNNYVHGPMK